MQITIEELSKYMNVDEIKNTESFLKFLKEGEYTSIYTNDKVSINQDKKDGEKYIIRDGVFYITLDLYESNFPNDSFECEIPVKKIYDKENNRNQQLQDSLIEIFTLEEKFKGINLILDSHELALSNFLIPKIAFKKENKKTYNEIISLIKVLLENNEIQITESKELNDIEGITIIITFDNYPKNEMVKKIKEICSP
jgi:hypothetical protein